MKHEYPHLSDEQLLLDVDGELSAQDAKQVKAHLDACWGCRARRQELEGAITTFVRGYQRGFDGKLPSSAGPRALLRAQLAQLSALEARRKLRWSEVLRRPAWKIAGTAILLLGLFLSRAGYRNSVHSRTIVFSLPDSQLTPGAASNTDRQTVCASENTNNKAVSSDMQKRVFQEYGIGDVQPQAYEIDYLVTPALGGSDDIHNLWPHSYRATEWNARVKDDLESRMRVMVCAGSLDLAEAQHEISANWISAYKKYFRTEKPLSMP